MEGFMYKGGVVDHLQAILAMANGMRVLADYGCIFRASSHMPTFCTDPVAPSKRDRDPIFRRFADGRRDLGFCLYETGFTPHGMGEDSWALVGVAAQPFMARRDWIADPQEANSPGASCGCCDRSECLSEAHSWANLRLWRCLDGKIRATNCETGITSLDPDQSS